MISIQQITKSYGKIQSLGGVSSEIGSGSIFGLIGSNGSGKSTAIRHALGVYRPDSGSVTFDGESVYENPAAKIRISSIPDDVFFFPSASLEEMRNFY